METIKERQRGNDVGETGRTVAQNVRTVRVDQNMTQAELSAALTTIGRPIPVASIGKLESGLRKIDLDDFMALAVALNVSPLRLLLPDTRRPSDEVQGTGIAATAADAWLWALGTRPLPGMTAKSEQQFQSDSAPWWVEAGPFRGTLAQQPETLTADPTDLRSDTNG
jgi:transcriptional regulator with XRE-family HTH domain